MHFTQLECGTGKKCICSASTITRSSHKYRAIATVFVLLILIGLFHEFIALYCTPGTVCIIITVLLTIRRFEALQMVFVLVVTEYKRRLKKNLNAFRPPEHLPIRGQKCLFKEKSEHI